ncbi:hypothetical protein ACHAL6_11650 [Proteiniclasticum sp. C24MP]|uniref:hypothetical protein n=1 Tax=Proteiniclasticum sp. C24MP TaxID=3374101 RepID=UPI0037541F29
MNRELYEKAVQARQVSNMKIAMEAGISPSDFYQALKGLKPFFPRWRDSLCEVLDLREEDLFPEENSEV